MSDPLKDIHGRSFIEGQEAIAREVKERRFEDHTNLVRRAAEVAFETIDEVEKLASDGNTQKQRMVEAIRLGIENAMHEVLSGRATPQGESVPVAENPFSNSSPKSVTASNDSTKALSDQTPSEPAKRGRGRPRKNP